MESLDDLVTQTQGLSGRKDDLVHLQAQLQSSGAEVLSRSSQAEMERVLSILDPEDHSLSFLYVLDALSSLLMNNIPPLACTPSSPSHPTSPPRRPALNVVATAAAEHIVSAVSSFIVLCSPNQIRMDPMKFTLVCRRLKDALLALSPEQQSIRGVYPLRTALEKLQPTREHLTPLHSDFLQLCLLSRCYSSAYHLLSSTHSGTPLGHQESKGGRGTRGGVGSECSEQLRYEIDPSQTGITQTDFLLFCYYGGMICCGLKKLNQASRLFLQAITAPAVGLSAITVAAHKKYILLSLILHGKLHPLPRFTPSAVQRQLKAHIQEYSGFAEEYSHRDSQALQALITKHEKLFKKDGNLGLAKQVLASVLKLGIQRLTQTYVTLSLEDIAQSVKLSSAKEAERHILRMIEDGDIHASINQRDGMVSFSEDPERYNTYSMAHLLNSHISRTIELNRKVEDMESSIASDKQYLHRVHLREKTGRFADPEEIDFGGGPSRMFDTM